MERVSLALPLPRCRFGDMSVLAIASLRVLQTYVQRFKALEVAEGRRSRLRRRLHPSRCVGSIAQAVTDPIAGATMKQ